MYKKTLLLTTLVVFSLTGCISSHYYILSNVPKLQHTYAQTHMRIGVEKVVVPEYLFKRQIAIAKSQSEVAFVSDGSWAEDVDTGLTTRLIGFLQKKFNQPNVHLYPWDTDTQPTKKVKVHISRFIAEGKDVSLDATWEVETMATHHSVSKLFHITLKAEDTSTSAIVKAMNNAFSHLENDIARAMH